MASPLDRTTVEALYRRYGAQVERICRRILGDGDEAADATQEVFIKLFTRGGGFRGESNWMTWLYRVAVHECLGRVKKKSKHQQLLEHHGDPVRPGTLFDPAVLTNRSTLRRLLERVDDRTLAMAIYRHLFDMSLREIGEVAGMSAMAVHKRLEKLEKRARKYL